MSFISTVSRFAQPPAFAAAVAACVGCLALAGREAYKVRQVRSQISQAERAAVKKQEPLRSVVRRARKVAEATLTIGELQTGLKALKNTVLELPAEVDARDLSAAVTKLEETLEAQAKGAENLNTQIDIFKKKLKDMGDLHMEPLNKAFDRCRNAADPHEAALAIIHMLKPSERNRRVEMSGTIKRGKFAASPAKNPGRTNEKTFAGIEKVARETDSKNFNQCRGALKKAVDAFEAAHPVTPHGISERSKTALYAFAFLGAALLVGAAALKVHPQLFPQLSGGVSHG